jgi:hypothetical protein
MAATEGASLTMEILDRHVELATWAESQEAVEHLDMYLARQREADRAHGYVSHTAAEGAVGEFAAERIAEELGYAETYWISPDMCDVIEQGVETIGTSPLHASDVPARHGFIQFARPMEILVDEHDEPWGPVAVSWSVLDDPDRGNVTSWYDQEQQLHQSAGIGITWWLDTRQAFESWAKDGDVLNTRLPWAFVGQLTGWTFDLLWGPEDSTSPRDTYNLRGGTSIDESGTQQRKLLYVTFVLLQEEIVRVWKERAPRGAVRRAERKLHTPEPGDVRIVDLRTVRVIGKPEPEEGDGNGEPIMWTHRWLSREHWRTLHRGDPEKERQVYVNWSIKGPAHLPFIVKDRLSRLVR